MEFFTLAILFTTGGALVGAVVVKTLVSILKQMGLLPEHGRGILLAVAAISAVLIGLACLDAPFLRDGIAGDDIFLVFLSWLGLHTASVGTHEVITKGQAILSGSTNPVGPDVP